MPGNAPATLRALAKRPSPFRSRQTAVTVDFGLGGAYAGGKWLAA
jgi:hypothetical protein